MKNKKKSYYLLEFGLRLRRDGVRFSHSASVAFSLRRKNRAEQAGRRRNEPKTANGKKRREKEKRRKENKEKERGFEGEERQAATGERMARAESEQQPACQRRKNHHAAK